MGHAAIEICLPKYLATYCLQCCFNGYRPIIKLSEGEKERHVITESIPMLGSVGTLAQFFLTKHRQLEKHVFQINGPDYTGGDKIQIEALIFLLYVSLEALH